MKNYPRMVRPYLLFLFFLITQVTSTGQRPFSSRIFLQATTSVVSGEYFIDILANADSTKIIFKLKDRLRLTELNQDTNTINYRRILESTKNFSLDNDTVRIFANKLDSIFHAYTVYSIDSITISNKQYGDYYKLLHVIFNTPTDKLENKDRVVLDGTRMKFTLTDKGTIRNVYAHSPTATSHPMLYQLITETTGLYRELKKNDFLTKRRTAGY